MGMGNPEPIYYSADMVRELQADDRAWPRYETVYGELLVTMAPRPLHQRVVFRLARKLADYLERQTGIGEAFMSPADISWGLPDVMIQPDVFVIPDAASRAITAGGGWSVVPILPLAAEVLSPSTKRQDRFTKRKLYQDRGTPLYWIVDVDTRTVEVWTPADDFPRFEREQLHWHPEGASAPFTLSLDELFADA